MNIKSDLPTIEGTIEGPDLAAREADPPSGEIWLRLDDVLHAPGPEFDLVIPELALRKGRLTALVGPNGSGKSTLLGLISGATPLKQGAISLLGAAPGRLPVAARADLGWQTQDSGFNPHFRVEGLIRLHKAAYAVSDDAVFAAFGLPEIASRRMSALSSGQKQRLQLALALAHHPDLAIFDEPTSALDPLYEQSFVEALAQERRRNPAFTALFVTHSRAVVDACDDLLWLKRGRVVDSGPKGRILAERFGEVGAAFEAAPKAMQALVPELKALPGARHVRRRGARVLVYGGPELRAAAFAFAQGRDLSRFAVWSADAADLLESFKDE